MTQHALPGYCCCSERVDDIISRARTHTRTGIEGNNKRRRSWRINVCQQVIMTTMKIMMMMMMKTMSVTTTMAEAMLTRPLPLLLLFLLLAADVVIRLRRFDPGSQPAIQSSIHPQLFSFLALQVCLFIHLFTQHTENVHTHTQTHTYTLSHTYIPTHRYTHSLTFGQQQLHTFLSSFPHFFHVPTIAVVFVELCCLCFVVVGVVAVNFCFPFFMIVLYTRPPCHRHSLRCHPSSMNCPVFLFFPFSPSPSPVTLSPSSTHTQKLPCVWESALGQRLLA